MSHVEIARTAGGYELRAQAWLPQKREDVFSFFADAGNLEVLTPPWLNFQILTPEPIEMVCGARIEYRLRLRGLPIRWRTEISEWDPPFSFVDRQAKGPYQKWVHRHTFEEKDGGTLMTDTVSYAVPGGALMHRLFVRRDLLRIFGYRRAQLRRVLPALGASAGS